MKKIYDYRCNKCGHQWEDYRGEDDTPLCVMCMTTDVKRLISTPMIAGETPYKTLDKYGIPDKKIVSGPYHRSK